MQGAQGGFIVLMVSFVVIFVLLAISKVMVTNRRQQAVEDRVRQAGWQVVAVPDREIQELYSGKPDRPPGRGRVHNLITGRHRDRDFVVFTLGYTSGTGASSRSRYFTHAAVPLPGPAPRVGIERRGTDRATASRSGAQVFQLGEPEFDDGFTVFTDDEAFARALLQPGLAAWLTGQPSVSPLVVDGSELRTWTRGGLSLDELPHTLDYLCDAMERIPARVWPVPSD